MTSIKTISTNEAYSMVGAEKNNYDFEWSATPRRDLQILLDMLSSKHRNNVLEIGTFAGHTSCSFKLTSPKSNVYTIDISTDMYVTMQPYGPLSRILRLPRNRPFAY